MAKAGKDKENAAKAAKAHKEFIKRYSYALRAGMHAATLEKQDQLAFKSRCAAAVLRYFATLPEAGIELGAIPNLVAFTAAEQTSPEKKDAIGFELVRVTIVELGLSRAGLLKTTKAMYSPHHMKQVWAVCDYAALREAIKIEAKDKPKS
jgi:hypothetical protein